jgi:S1-C subfamily serine protease
MRVFVYVIFFCYRLPLAQAFTCGAVTARDTRSSCPYVIGSSARLVRHSALKVPASELESNLSDAERTTVRVVRQAGPSVAFVTSVWPRSNSTRAESSAPGTGAPTTNLPLGQSLGSGSAFVVDAAGYLATNYHVIERAYQLQTAERTFQSVSDQVLGNISAATGLDVSNFFRCVLESSLPIRPAPSVFVRLNSATRYQECRIVDVQPDLDLAVLQIVPDVDSSEVFQPVSFGISSDLLVGQGLIAIGNP